MKYSCLGYYILLYFWPCFLIGYCHSLCNNTCNGTNHHKRIKRSFHPFRSERYLSTETTRILDALFNSGYDRQIRPQIEGPPLQVEVNIAIRSMGPVDEAKQTFALDCYFRQFWTDNRLEFNSTTSLDELAMNWAFLNKIWRPDTYILNGKNSYLHKMTVPNRFIRISPTGRISYSQRLTLIARCQMDLHKFPLDSQNCPLEIGSFGHDSDNIVYKWSEKPLTMDEFELSQYDLIKWSTFSNMIRLSTANGFNVSLVSLEFVFQRQTGFFLLQIYVPLTLIVCCSWVTFWLMKTDKGSEIPARTSLGATTVLSVVTIGFGGKGKPQVGYPTALDVFIIICFVTVFAALVEFAILNFFDTLVRRIKKKDRERKTILNFIKQLSPQQGLIREKPRRTVSQMSMNDDGLEDENLLSPEDEEPTNEWVTIETMVVDNGVESTKNKRVEPETIALSDIVEIHLTWTDRCWDCLENLIFKLNCSRKPVRSMEIFKNSQSVFRRVDGASKVLFPLSFILFNFAYWTTYMYIL